MRRETAMAAAIKAAGLDPDVVELRLMLAKIINHGRISEGVCHREVSAAYAKSSEARPPLPNGHATDASSRPEADKAGHTTAANPANEGMPALSPELPGTATSDAPQGLTSPAAPRQPESPGVAQPELPTDIASDAISGRPQSDEAGHRSLADPAKAAVSASSPPSELPGEAMIVTPQGLSSPASSRQPNDAAGLRSVANPATPLVPAASPPKRLVPYAGKEPSPLARKVMGSVNKKLAKVTVGYRVRDGRYLSDVKRGELRRLAQENREEALVLQSVLTVLNARHPDGDQMKTIGEYFEPEDLRRVIAGAQDIEHA